MYFKKAFYWQTVDEERVVLMEDDYFLVITIFIRQDITIYDNYS